MSIETVPLTDVRSFRFGPDLYLGGEHNYDFAVITEFEERRYREAYMKLPKHPQRSTDVILPLTSEFAATQFKG